MLHKILIIFFLLSSIAYAQPAPLGIQEEGGTISRPVNILDCVGEDIICSHSGQTGTITQKMFYDAIEDCPNSNRCFVYNQSNEQLYLYVNNVIQMKWPQLPAAVNYLLLETGDKLLIEGSATDAILLE